MWSELGEKVWYPPNSEYDQKLLATGAEVEVIVLRPPKELGLISAVAPSAGVTK